MAGQLRTRVCLAIWVMIVARVGAQAGDNLQAPDTMSEPRFTQEGIRRFVNGPTSTSVDARAKILSRLKDAGLERIGGKVEEDQDVTKWVINGHSYALMDEAERARSGMGNGHTGGVHRTLWRGEATREGPHSPIADLMDVNGEERVSGAAGDVAEEESPGASLSGPGENKGGPAAGPGVDSADWSRESGHWMYREGEWAVVVLPDTAFPSLPAPPSLPAALVVVANNTVEVERNVSGLVNVTLHYRFYLSEGDDQQDPAASPELKVYYVVDGARNLLQQESVQDEWLSRTLDVPEADVTSILFEGRPGGDNDVIALSNVDTTGVTLDEGEPLDVDDQFTLHTNQSNTTDASAPTPSSEGNQTQGLPALGEHMVSQQTESEDQDNTTAASVLPADAQVDSSLNSTVNTSQSNAEGEAAPDDVTELEASTDSPQNETQTSEQLQDSTAIVALNSSTTGSDDMIFGNTESDFSNSTMTIDKEEGETDEGESTIASLTDDEADTSEVVLGTSEGTDNTSIVSIPGVTSDALQANSSITFTVASTTGVPFISTDSYGSLNTPSGPTTTTESTGIGEAISKNVFGGDELTAETTLGAPQPGGTSGNIISPSGMAVSPEGMAVESTPFPTPAGNNTEAVAAAPENGTSWQVFQVFLVLCVLGLLTLGFLYWKRRRRQDDEIPVFTRHAEYPNPTFSMEDAANFMSRAGRNSYKTIE